MFGLFGKKKPETAMDVFIKTLYGDPPPPKRANLQEAIRLADENLLMGLVPNEQISSIAAQLNNGPIPYSTHDLAVSVALNFFKRAELNQILSSAQLMARLSVMEWLSENKLAPLLVQSFEDTLYKLYKS